MELPPRKTRRSFNEPGHAHYLTYSCHGRWPLLSKERSRQWVIDAMQRVRLQFKVDIWAYVVMPEHVHVLLSPRSDDYDMEAILACLKRPVSVAAKAYLEQSGQTHWLERLTVVHGGRNVFRFWQAGGGYDENLWNEQPVRQVIDYIHCNPVRRGLAGSPCDWEWSSARFWNGQRPVPLQMDPLGF